MPQTFFQFSDIDASKSTMSDSPSESLPSSPGRGYVASFPLCHQVRGRYAEQLLDSRACLCLDDAGQDITIV